MAEIIEIMDENALNRAITRISHEIVEKNKGTENLVIVGIKTRGMPIARRIAENIRSFESGDVVLGSVDITDYRDDKKKDGKCRTENIIDIDVQDKNVVLVDDVIYTGRTCRAAINAVMDKGRPQKIQLAVIVDRGHRELPIRPDYAGKNVPTSRDETIRVLLKEQDDRDGVLLTKKGGAK
ncbi:bifunctional pyr operon transcriptional regulator/uracil phosphoribosyltransferase PyrR [Alkalibacter mobilis]|uniref:bifunctional pyr operon transcriptional regulator/uracil phosphoribosyltransferase PyrR n=1 Tax=Alkalibacter mobilis TaxID=2787712 RepID=UPI00189C73FC|nr:bifunctional pyr operon transcriptional regulator/uracil phosphoribosyltransferase PyrR [Alkalibacter mobilis]MBF7097841.1 bifunctional pyr operon transcriptional regulator/uracil phosphoribosyltransferase PyrR [Alkalibacter mobilis]